MIQRFFYLNVSKM